MKPLYFVVSFALCSSTAIAQDTTWFDISWKVSDARHARYFRTKIRSAAGWEATDHWLDGKIQMTGTFKEDSLKTRAGEFVWYDTSGAVNHRCNYVNDKQNGPATHYFPNGQIRMAGNMKDDKFDGEWQGFYSSGKLASKATFRAGDQVSATFYKEDGTSNAGMKAFYSDAEYPGGVARWLYFLNRNLRYPDSAVTHNIEGTVVILFKVSKDGIPSEFTVDMSADAYLDAEALRVLKKTTKWQPAIFGGVYTDSYKLQPIVFKLTAD